MPRSPYNPNDVSDTPLFATLGRATSAANPPQFHGAGYDEKLDRARLTKQIAAVYSALRLGGWFTLREIAVRAGCGEASASAQLRNLRKPQFGGHVIERRRRYEAGETAGVWTYRLKVAEQASEGDDQ